MANFHTRDAGFSTLSKEQLDTYAKTGQSLGGTGAQYGIHDNNVKERHGYTIRWIATHGTGNFGTAVLVGTTRETRQNVRNGKIHLVSERHQVPRDLARIIVDSHLTLEAVPIDLALESFMEPFWHTYPGIGNGVREWANSHEVGHKLTAPRIEMVWGMVQALLKEHGVDESGVNEPVIVY